jgi:MFS family permease
MRIDPLAAVAGAALFSFALGITTVGVPLLALEAGYSLAEIGALASMSALFQIATRSALGLVLRRMPDRVLVLTAGLQLSAAAGLLAASSSLVPFIASMVLQGTARACFWTGSQTHVVRRPGATGSAIATVNFSGGIGLLAGPTVAGVLSARSPHLALGAGAAVAALTCLPALLLDRLPPFTPPLDATPGRIWRRPGVTRACWANATAGAWFGLLSSYVPIALSEHLSETAIGALVAVSNAAGLVGSGAAGRVRQRAMGRWLAALTLCTGLATSLVASVASQPVLVGAALAIAGLGAGALQTLGPAIVADAVHPEERGDAIAVTGTFRAAALFASPLGIAGLITVAPLSVAMGVLGVLMLLPALGSRRRVAEASTSTAEQAPSP